MVKRVFNNKNSSLITAVILFFLTTAYSAMIKDFAPLQIGTTWVYSYFGWEDLITTFTLDSMNITLKIQSKINRGTDTLILIDVHQQKAPINGPHVVPKRAAINLDSDYIDTVIARGDSIIPKNYRCPVFPFLSTHSIDQESLRKIKLGADSLFEYSNSYHEMTFNNTIHYIQNRGLSDRSTDHWLGVSPKSRKGENINLLSFNGNPIPVAVKSITYNGCSFQPKAFYALRLNLLQKRMHARTIYFDLNGKTIATRPAMSHGIIIEKQKTARR
jgi:hypothetical protein